MAHTRNAGSRPVHGVLGASLLGFGDGMLACFGGARAPAKRGWLRRLASLGRTAGRLDGTAGLTESHLKDIGVPPPRLAAGSLSADAATRLSIRANGGY